MQSPLKPTSSNHLEPGKQTTPQFIERPRRPNVESAALIEGFTPLQARLIAGRLDGSGESISSLIRPRLSELDTPCRLPDIEVAAGLIADAVAQRRPIAIVTDHDADGATSHAIIRLCLESWGVLPEQLTSLISHRMKEGYGVSQAFVQRFLPSLKPGTCIITADQGSTDEARIAVLRDAGHIIIVTDHHGVPEEGPPPSAHAVVNPVRKDSEFADQAIAGCHTALLVMAAVRERLISRKELASTAARASDYFDLCAVGTIADASSLGSSRNNRAIVRHGIRLMNERPRACWQALRRLLKKANAWTATDIAFQVATRINARGRLDDAKLSVEFLMAIDEEDAYRIANELDESNRQRRQVERANTLTAVGEAQAAVADGRFGLCLWLGDQGHAGVHGISASRIVERFGRPTICLSPATSVPEYVTGSIRSTERVHVRNALIAIQDKHPGLLISAGGHAGAGGLRVRRSDVSRLVDAWDDEVREAYGDVEPFPHIHVDGDLDRPSLEHAEQIRALEPYGRGFERPLFCGHWMVLSVKPIGDGTHLKLSLARGPDRYEAVWFGAKEAREPLPISGGQRIRAVYGVEANEFRGSSRLQLLISHAEVCGAMAPQHEAQCEHSRIAATANEEASELRTAP